MNRLWVRLSLMLAGVLFLVFFIEFLSITIPHLAGWDAPGEGIGPGPNGGPIGDASNLEIASRLIEWMAFSSLVGVVGGVLIGRRVSAPINKLAQAAHRIGQGDLSVRVEAGGSREIEALAATFNKMAADLQHAETLRNNLMADVSHELRTPLTVLEGNLRAALDHVYALDEAEIANLYGQTRHLIRLVNDLRELALAEAHRLPLELQETDLAFLLAETLQALEPLAVERGVRLVLEPVPCLVVFIDPIRIRQVLFNLLTNALQHTPPDGEIRAGGSAPVVHPVDVGKPGLTRHASGLGKAPGGERSTGATGNGVGEVSLFVQDTGEGLEPEQLAAVFDRFYRADKSRSRETGGSGLGLAIVKAIVEAHGGRVEAHSAGKSQGSRFVVFLPVSRTA